MEELIDYVRVSFSIENIEGKNFYSLLSGLDHSEQFLHDYTHEFNIVRMHDGRGTLILGPPCMK